MLLGNSKLDRQLEALSSPQPRKVARIWSPHGDFETHLTTDGRIKIGSQQIPENRNNV